MTSVRSPGRDLSDLRLEVCNLHAYLPENDLVSWTSGSISARVPNGDAMIIKPSGVLF